MVEIQLTKAVRIPPAQSLQWSGKVFDVEEAFAEELVTQGKAIYVTPDVEATATKFVEVRPVLVADTDDTTDDSVDGNTPEVDETSDTDGTTESAEVENIQPPTTRPKKTAPIAVWREYAASKGLKTTGMKLQEIIGAIESQNL